MTAKKICLITPGHLASNPRLVKEAQALTTAGYKVHLVFTQYVLYLIDFDLVILKKNPSWTYDCLNRTSRSISVKSLNYTAAMIQKPCVMLLLRGKKSDFIFCRAINRYFSWQLKKAVAAKADLYIGHNLAALPVAVFSAQKNKVKCGFDAEDFHRNEMSDDKHNTDYQLKTMIEDKFFPKLDYLTVASPMIGEVYQQLYKNHTTTILNTFPRAVNVLNFEATYPLKLIWFSQYIGFNRGLETIFTALESFTELNIELHLIGFLSPEMDEFMHRKFPLSAVISKITVHDPIPPDQLIGFISKFDIGLAIETGKPLNREICLTNKIFSYIQAGLAVLASDTKSQIQLLSTHPEIGILYDKNSITNLIEALNAFYFNPKYLLQCKLAAFNLGQMHFNWETESQKFLKIVAETLA